MAVGEERDTLQDIQKALQGGEKEELVVKAILELQQGSSKSIRATEWSKLDGLLHFQGKIYIPNDPELW